MDWDLLKTIVLGVFAAAVVVSTTLIGLLYGALRTLRESNNDLRLRVSDLEKERAEDKSDKSKLSTEKAALATENGLLWSRLQGKSEWIALNDQLEEHHRQALVWWAEIKALITRILTAMGEAK